MVEAPKPNSREQFIPINDPCILDKLDQILEDKDTFLVKLPHRFKEALANPRATEPVYTLTTETCAIGRIEPVRKKVKRVVEERQRPDPEIEIDELLEDCKDTFVADNYSNDAKIEMLMPLNLPSRSDRSTKE